MTKADLITDLERSLARQKENEDSLFAEAADILAQKNTSRKLGRTDINSLRRCLKDLAEQAEMLTDKGEQLKEKLKLVQSLD